MMDALDRRILLFIAAHAAAHGYPPTVREIADEIGRDVSATHGRLRRLEASGLLTNTENSPRTRVLTAAGVEMVKGEKSDFNL